MLGTSSISSGVSCVWRTDEGGGCWSVEAARVKVHRRPEAAVAHIRGNGAGVADDAGCRRGSEEGRRWRSTCLCCLHSWAVGTGQAQSRKPRRSAGHQRGVTGAESAPVEAAIVTRAQARLEDRWAGGGCAGPHGHCVWAPLLPSLRLRICAGEADSGGAVDTATPPLSITAPPSVPPHVRPSALPPAVASTSLRHPCVCGT